MLSTGFFALDAALLGGLHSGRMYLIASRPGLGKSTLALQIACNVAIEQSRRVLFFSMEDTEDQLKAKANAFIPPGTLVSTLAFQTQDFRFQEMSRIAHEHRSAKGLDLIVFDYIQLMDLDDYPFTLHQLDPRERRISELCRELKMLAKILEVPVLVLSQVNRGLEFRPDKRPLLSDLRESGALADDPDVVAFIYRDEHYYADSKDKGTAEIIVRKIRGGECSTLQLGYEGKPPRFSSL